MKSRYKQLMACVAMAFILSLSCNSDDPQALTRNEIAFEKLAGAWTLGASGSIKLDAVDVSLNYPGFSLSFTDGAYQTLNAADLLSASGTWQWVGEEANMVRLDSGEQLHIQTLSENTFSFSFTHAGTGGEAAGIAGVYEITVVK